MIAPLLISEGIALVRRVWPSEKSERNNSLGVHKEPIRIDFEAIIPKISETSILLESYLAGRSESEPDALDAQISLIFGELKKITEILGLSGVRKRISQSFAKENSLHQSVTLIREEIAKIPAIITRLAYHSPNPLYQGELRELRTAYDDISPESAIGDIFVFFAGICPNPFKRTTGRHKKRFSS